MSRITTGNVRTWVTLGRLDDWCHPAIDALTISDLLRVVQDAERTLGSDLAIDDQSSIVADMNRETLGSDEVASVMSGVSITVR